MILVGIEAIVGIKVITVIEERWAIQAIPARMALQDLKVRLGLMENKVLQAQRDIKALQGFLERLDQRGILVPLVLLDQKDLLDHGE